MAKATRLEDALAGLNALKAQGPTAAAAAALKAALGQRSSLIVAKAAQLAGAMELAALAPDLTVAFARFRGQPAKLDKLCQAKTALVQALVVLGGPAEQVYLPAIALVQMEPVYGGQVDTAAEMRGLAAAGLLRMGHPQGLNLVAELLADPQPPARAGAIRALAESGRPEAGPLLRFKARLGDPDATVSAECLGGLLKVDGPAGLEHARQALAGENEALFEAAALALGSSRLAPAVQVLQEACEVTVEGPRRHTLALALAMLRQPAANDFLLAQVREGSRASALAALAALAMHRYDAALMERLKQAAQDRGEAEVCDAIRAALG